MATESDAEIPQVLIHDALTNETVVRQMTDEEYAEYLELKASAPSLSDADAPNVNE